jgi:hypothetical protein
LSNFDPRHIAKFTTAARHIKRSRDVKFNAMRLELVTKIWAIMKHIFLIGVPNTLVILVLAIQHKNRFAHRPSCKI